MVLYFLLFISQFTAGFLLFIIKKKNSLSPKLSHFDVFASQCSRAPLQKNCLWHACSIMFYLLCHTWFSLLTASPVVHLWFSPSVYLLLGYSCSFSDHSRYFPSCCMYLFFPYGYSGLLFSSVYSAGLIKSFKTITSRASLFFPIVLHLGLPFPNPWQQHYEMCCHGKENGKESFHMGNFT